ncbi:MAG: hypothetical protein ACREX0_02050 [Noviherbaspirillum sp.]
MSATAIAISIPLRAAAHRPTDDALQSMNRPLFDPATRHFVTFSLAAVAFCKRTKTLPHDQLFGQSRISICSFIVFSINKPAYRQVVMPVGMICLQRADVVLFATR